MRLQVSHIACGYGHTTIVDDVSFSLDSHEILCILGPNGVGKTTLFKSILGLMPRMAGLIEVDGQNIDSWPRKKLAQCFGYVPQSHTPPFPYSVFDVVFMGRTAHLERYATPSKDDVEIAQDTLVKLGIEHLEQRIYTQISGGERQMALIARALAQQPKFLIMDEPTASLDFGNQVRVLSRIQTLAREGLGIIMTSHSPDQAFLCASKVALLGNQSCEIGEPDEIVTEDNLRRIYGVDVRIVSEATLSAKPALKSCIPLLTDHQKGV